MSSVWQQIIIPIVLFLVALIWFTIRAMRHVPNATRWQWFIVGATKAPAALLALVASYGVSQFYVEAIPLWVACIGAVAYESVYISLSLQATRKDLDKLRYSFVSFSAVGMSAISNSLYAFAVIYFADTLISRALGDLTGLQHVYVSALLGVLHGAPLSVLSYNMLQLLAARTEHKVEPLQVQPVQNERKRSARRVHAPKAKRSTPHVTNIPEQEYQPAIMASTTVTAPYTTLKQKTLDIVQLWNAGHNKSQVARQVDLSRAGVTKHLNAATKAGLQVRQEK